MTSKNFNSRDCHHDLALRAAEPAATLPLKGADAIDVTLAAQLNRPLVHWDREQLRRGARFIDVVTPAAISILPG